MTTLLNALCFNFCFLLTIFNFQEEEDLVNAHRRQVEETMDIVREVCDY